MWVRELLRSGKLEEFYNSKYWVWLREEVLKDNKYQCRMCKQRGFYQKANTVHHVQYVRNHPRLALSRAYTFQGIEHENLLPLCHNCHEEIHNHRVKIQKEYLTEEKW